jgi:hypothetical protein
MISTKARAVNGPLRDVSLTVELQGTSLLPARSPGSTRRSWGSVDRVTRADRAFAGWPKAAKDFDKGAEFIAYKTYAWTAGTPVQNPLMDQRITGGIEKHLAAKGMKKVDIGANPDLVVLYHGAVGTETQLNTTNTGGYGWGYRRVGVGGMVSTTTVEKIPVGQLTVDIGDAKTKKLLWMGNASDTLSDKPEKNEKKINKALEKMFKKFPPSKG